MIKLKVGREVFQEAVRVAALAVSRRSTLPCLNAVALEFCPRAEGGGFLRVVGTDLECTASAALVLTEDPGGQEGRTSSYCCGFLSPRPLLAMLKAAPKGVAEVELEYTEGSEKPRVSGTTLVQCGPGRYVEPHNWLVEETTHFHDAWQDSPAEYAVHVPECTLLEAVRRTVYAAAPEDWPRPLLGQVLLETGHGFSRLVATDANRLSYADMLNAQPLVPALEATESAMLPAALLQMVTRAAGKSVEGAATIEVRERYVGVVLQAIPGRRPETRLWARRYDVIPLDRPEAQKPKFPTYHRTFPKGEPLTDVLMRFSDLKGAVQSVGSGFLVLKLRGNTMTVSGRTYGSDDDGSSCEVQMCVAKCGVQRFDVQKRFLLDMLKSEPSKDALLRMERDFMVEDGPTRRDILRFEPLSCGVALQNIALVMCVAFPMPTEGNPEMPMVATFECDGVLYGQTEAGRTDVLVLAEEVPV